ncbi:hypothetical protein Barb6_00283 [Bacteroidales bacterium Barb6]|nr:hypothetical protein Barb6_00283 [Bacteroidales bacterium Barb6]
MYLYYFIYNNLIILNNRRFVFGKLCLSVSIFVYISGKNRDILIVFNLKSGLTRKNAPASPFFAFSAH